jgi:hypothetical protein
LHEQLLHMIASAKLSFRYLLLPLNYPDTVAGQTDHIVTPRHYNIYLLL